MHPPRRATLVSLPAEVEPVHAGLRPSRLFAIAGLIVLMGGLCVCLNRWTQQETELLRFRSAMLEVAGTVRAMPSRALSKRQTVQLRIDAQRGVLQLTTLQPTRRSSYETVEHTIWLPKGLQIIDAPAVLTASQTGKLAPASILAAAQAYNRLFRLTTDASGAVQLHEDPTS